MKLKLLVLLIFLTGHFGYGQKVDLGFFLQKAEGNDPRLMENRNLLKVGALQNDLIRAQKKSFKIDATGDLLFAPFFKSNGKFMDITTNPSPNAYGYDVGITNGGLYSAQINVAKNILNQAIVDNLLFQNKLANQALELTSEEISRNIKKNITATYILTYQFQLQKNLTEDLIASLEKRLKIIGILVKHGILMESDYLLVQVSLNQKRIELQQIENNLRNSFAQLYNLSGIPFQGIKELSAPSLIPAPEKNQFFYQRRFKNDSLQLVADQLVFENKYKPKLSVFANAGVNAVELDNIYHKIGASAGIQLTIPIYDGHQKKINARQNLLKQHNLDYYRQNNQIKKENNLENFQAQITAQIENLNLMEAQLQNQKNVLEVYTAKLVKGQISVIDYLNVVQNYKMAVNTKLQMQTNLWLLQNQYNYINW